MQTVQFTMGMGSLKSPQKVRRYVLDWFRHLMTEQGIGADNVSSGKIKLTLSQNTNDNEYNYEKLYTEIIGWAKREYDIDLQFTVCHEPYSDFNQFYFIITINT